MKTKTAKPKHQLTAVDLIKELRGIANQLARNAESDMLDHVRVCSDTAKSIRNWLRTVEAQPEPGKRVVIELEGGNISYVYADDPSLYVRILDRDLAKVGEGNPARERALSKEIKTMAIVES